MTTKRGRFHRMVRFFGGYSEDARGEVTRHFILHGSEVGTAKSTIIRKTNRFGKIKWFCDDGDGYEYRVDKSQLW